MTVLLLDAINLFVLFSSFNCFFSQSERASVLGSMNQSWNRFQRLPGPHQQGPAEKQGNQELHGGYPSFGHLWVEGARWAVGSQGLALLCCQWGRDPQPWGPWGWAGTSRALGHSFGTQLILLYCSLTLREVAELSLSLAVPAIKVS